MRNTIWVLIAITALLTTASASGDPFVGEWVLDPQHSTYLPGTCPKQMVIQMDPAANGIRYRSFTTYKNGGTDRAEYTAEYNSRQVPVLGGRGFLLPVSLKRIDSRTVVASYMRGFQVVATSRRVVSGDGLRMTIITTSKDRSGRKVTTIGIYRKKLEKRQDKS